MNLTLPRSGSTGPLATHRAPGLLPLLKAPPDRRTKLSDDMEKAGKPDCRAAYADKGLLAIVPLASSALGADAGCRW